MTDAADGYRWPDDTPDGCPPRDAEETDLLVYRFVKNDPPGPVDFQRPVDNPSNVPDDPCTDCALSVLADPGDIPAFRRIIPGFKKRKVAQGHIKSGDGLVKKEPLLHCTPSIESHHDWWVPLEAQPSVRFTVVDL